MATHLERFDLDAKYNEARRLAQQQLAAGDLLQMRLESNATNGRMIFVRSDQGWDPDPFYQDFHEDPWFPPLTN